MVNYSQSIIYKIVSNNPEIKELYIGSTTNFSRRKCQHKTSCNNIKSKEYNFNVYQFIRDNGDWCNWSMILIEEYKCNSSMELLKRERYWIETLKATLNNNVPFRSSKEKKEYRQHYYRDKKDNYKQYYIDNRERLVKRKRLKTKCFCGGRYSIDHKSKHFKTKKHLSCNNVKKIV